MTDSHLHSQIEETSETPKLTLKFEQEQRDSEKRESEMQRIRTNFKFRTRDHIAPEILHIPEDRWQLHGDYMQTTFDDNEPFKLYCKGLYETVGEGSKLVRVAAIGVAVCDPDGNLVLNVQKPLVGDWESDWEEDHLQLKVELKALMEGLNAALTLDIKEIEFFCDFYPLFQYITMKWRTKQQNIRTTVDQVGLLQQKFASCCPFLVAHNDVKFAFGLARDAVESQIARSAASSRARKLKETCSICSEDTDVGHMFVIDGCSHRYCVSCMKQHVEVKLLLGMLPRCPHEGCNTQLTIPICRRFVPPDLIDLMNQRMEESSIPATEKIYCPYPKCSTLMSKAQVLPYTNGVFCGIKRSAIKKCIQCHGLFCINCMVPWHKYMSCYVYKSLNPRPSAEDAKLMSLAKTQSWRQCMKCKNMIELDGGCFHITCRCGYEFCYICGAGWRNENPTCSCLSEIAGVPIRQAGS